MIDALFGGRSPAHQPGAWRSKPAHHFLELENRYDILNTTFDIVPP